MKRNPPETAPVERWLALRPRESDPFGLDIEIDEVRGTVRVYDPRAFHAGRRAFCRRLLEAASERPGMIKGEIDLAAASCRLEFDPGSATLQGMAQALSDAVHRAADASVAHPGRWNPLARRWTALTAYRNGGDASFWETIESGPGRLRLRQPGLSGDRARLARLADSLAGLEGVEACGVSGWFHTLTIDFRTDRTSVDTLLDGVESGLQRWCREPIEGDRPVPAVAGGTVPLAGGLQRVGYLALAGGSFAMTVLGLVVPGVPTVPFLLATSYYLARSSPRLNERLRRAAFFGPILDEWERHRALSWTSKGKLLSLTAAIVVVTVALTPLSPVAIVLILVISSISVWGVARLPGLPGETGQPARLDRPARPALMSP